MLSDEDVAICMYILHNKEEERKKKNYILLVK